MSEVAHDNGMLIPVRHQYPANIQQMYYCYGISFILEIQINSYLCHIFIQILLLSVGLYTLTSFVLFTGDSSSFVYHGQWLALCPLYRWQFQLCLPWTMASSVLFTGGSSSFVYHGQWLVLCPLYRWQLQLCLPWTMTSSVLFTGGSSSFVYHGQWKALSSLQVVAVALFTMDNGQSSPLYRWQLQFFLLSTMASSVLLTGGSCSFVYH